MTQTAISILIGQAKFLDYLRDTGGAVAASARAIGVNPSTVHRWRNADKEFAKAWDEVIGEKIEILEQTAYSRAVHGTQEPVIYKGEQMGKWDAETEVFVPLTITRYDNTLLVRLLEAENPAKWKRGAEVQVNLGDELVQRLTAGRARVGRK